MRRTLLCLSLLLLGCGGAQKAVSLDWLVGKTGVWRAEHSSEAVVVQRWQQSTDGVVGKGTVTRGETVVGGAQHQITHDRGMTVLIITPFGEPSAMLLLEKQDAGFLSFKNEESSKFPARVIYELRGEKLRVRLESADGRGVEHTLSPSTE